jgi:hypothetical protein
MGGGGKKNPTQQVFYKSDTRLMNMFSVLAETDSEEEAAALPAVLPAALPAEEQEQEQEAPVSDSSDSDTVVSEVAPAHAHAPLEPQQKEQSSPQFRVWKGDDSRFSAMKNNIFSSPFSRKKPRRFTKEEEWTSIQVGTTPTYSPLTQPSESQSDIPQLNLTPSAFPSLLTRGTSATVNDVDVSEEQSALAWAEKVKLTLERAGQGRSEMKRAASKSDMSGNIISFFRRSIVLDEKF